MHYTTCCNTQSSAPEDGRDQRPKHVELIGIINKPLLLHLVGVHIIYNKIPIKSFISQSSPAVYREHHHRDVTSGKCLQKVGTYITQRNSTDDRIVVT